MTGFVDDTKGQMNDISLSIAMPLAQLIAIMQAEAQLWGDLLHVSGGAMEIPKSNHYVMKWKFNPSGIPELNADINTILSFSSGGVWVT
jgi:hypothetical protein